MSSINQQIVETSQAENIQTDERVSGGPTSLFSSVRNYAMLGASAALLLAAIEVIDLNVRLSTLFQNISERLIFTSYFSLNLACGFLIGSLLGIVIRLAQHATKRIEKAVAPKGPKAIHRLFAVLAVSTLAAIVLNQQPQIHGHAYEIIREAEKFETLTSFLLNHERSVSYLILMAAVAGCSLLGIATLILCRPRRSVSWIWIMGLLSMIAVVYYVDSRFETQLYATSVHRSMFIMDTALTMALISSIGGCQPKKLSKMAVVFTLSILVLLTTFTFIYFDKDQNLKTQLFAQTTQAKQYFRLAQWVLDFDRDGYSAVLGGGDCDDRNGALNPGRPAIFDDHTDNNCIGGPISLQGLEDWKQEHSALHVAPETNAKRYNVIYVFIDALRADHLSAYGYSRKTSPNLDKLAARSALFQNAYTPAPNTFEALPKFTQGAYWDAHLEGWPEIMARSGYQALLFPRRISTLRRHVKGMKVLPPSKDGTFEGSIDGAIETLRGIPTDQPFCAYLYSTDTHRPYRPHSNFQYGSSSVDLYDGEISYLDFHLGRLFDWMETAGRMEDTIIVIMADHGESLGERGVYKHSTLLYNEQTRVPMIIHVPGLAARLITDYVSTIDLGPTMLSAVGLDYPKECAGVSLLGLIRGQPFAHPPVYGEQTTQELSPFVRPDQYVSPEQKKYMVITQDGFKLIYNRDYYSFELYDLKNDPGEIRNLYDRLPEKATELRQRLGRFVDVVTVSRPWDADESQYFFGPTGEAREAK